jgi:hypothetical protein
MKSASGYKKQLSFDKVVKLDVAAKFGFQQIFRFQALPLLRLYPGSDARKRGWLCLMPFLRVGKAAFHRIPAVLV